MLKSSPWLRWQHKSLAPTFRCPPHIDRLVVSAAPTPYSYVPVAFDSCQLSDAHMLLGSCWQSSNCKRSKFTAGYRASQHWGAATAQSVYRLASDWTVLGSKPPVPVKERSKARVCGRSLAGVTVSNPAGGWKFVLWVLYSKDKRHNQGNQDKVVVQGKYREQKKKSREARFFAPVQTGPGTRPASYTLATRSLSRR
jgi:hypothetical protein